jgi:hypothetical protein
MLYLINFNRCSVRGSSNSPGKITDELLGLFEHILYKKSDMGAITYGKNISNGKT